MGQVADDRSLSDKIAASDKALQHHRLQSYRMTGALEDRVRRRISSPAALTIAATVGFALGKTRHSGSRSLLNLLKTATQATLLHRAMQ